MGKASRQLNQARQECYETNENTYNYSDKDLEELKQEAKELNESYDRETAEIIRTQLIEYSQNGAYPLCEYLDIENTTNFTKWLLKL
jgi:hypothetical protein